MADQRRKVEQFRGLHIPGKPLVLFNIWDAGSAKAVAAGGAKAFGANEDERSRKLILALAEDPNYSGWLAKLHAAEDAEARLTAELEAAIDQIPTISILFVDSSRLEALANDLRSKLSTYTR